MDLSKLGRIRPESSSSSSATSASKKEADELFGDVKRLESLKETLHWAIIWAVKVASIGMILLFMVRLYHLAAPETWTWLSMDRLQKLDSLLFSGFLGAFVAKYLNQAVPSGTQREQSLSPGKDS